MNVIHATAPKLPFNARAGPCATLLAFPPATSGLESRVATDGHVCTMPTHTAAVDSRLPDTRLVPARSRREYAAGEIVFSQGKPADAVFFIQRGRVKLTVTSASGREAVVAILRGSHFFGEGCLANQPLCIVTARVLDRSTIVRIEKTMMSELLHRNPAFADRFRTHLLARNIRMEADLVDHLFNSSEKRLARALLLMANYGQESLPVPVIHRISQGTLAKMIGTTRSRVSFFLNRFRELGYISYNRRCIHVHISLFHIVLHD